MEGEKKNYEREERIIKEKKNIYEKKKNNK